MISNIKKLEAVKSLLTEADYQSAVSGLFKDNHTKITDARKSIVEAKELHDNAATSAVRNTLKRFVEIQTHDLTVLKAIRKEANDYIQCNQNAWAEESPINLNDIFVQMFTQRH